MRRDLGDAGEPLAATAKAAYKARLDELQAELDQAGRLGDPVWGHHYPRLAQVKHRYDPGGLCSVHHGVGTETRSADRPSKRS